MNNKLILLSKHRKLHDRPYRCTVSGCGWSERGFASQGDLDKHMNTRHREQLKQYDIYYCPSQGCHREFSRRDNVKRHMKIRHGSLLGEEPIKQTIRTEGMESRE